MLKVRTRSSRDWHAVWQAVDAADSFTNPTGSFSGESSRGCDAGELYGVARDLFREHVDARMVTYVIKSYRTPIAWQVTYSDGSLAWFVPDTRHSVTTSKHQTIARIATSHSVSPATQFAP